jgi:hypothetical protein
MKIGMRTSATLATSLLLSLSLLLLPLLFSSATAEASSASSATGRVEMPGPSQQTSQEVIARIRAKEGDQRELLARSGVVVLRTGKQDDLYIRATSGLADRLRAEGWEIEVLYEGDGYENWRSVAPAGECLYNLDPFSRSFADAGGNSSFGIFTAADCDWLAISSVDWVTINGINQGQGNGTIFFSVAQNNSSSPRTGAIVIAGLVFQIFQGADFDDVDPGDPFYLEIGKISGRGLTVGCSSTSFCPNNPVSREQMAAFILRALGEFNPPDPAMQRFADVPPSNPFYRFIDRLAALNITLGCGGNNFCPADPVNRQQMAAFLLRAIGEFNPPVPAQQRFSDVPPTNPFYNFIDRLAVLGITSGCGPDIFCPDDSVTRGQMAAFLVRTFNL